jgi:Ca2+-binding RTX toxin-like protein
MPRQLLVWAYLVATSVAGHALAGCAVSDRFALTPEQDAVEIAVAEADLGVPIGGCANTGFSGGTLTLTVDTDPLVLGAPGGKFTANGFVCTGLVGIPAKTGPLRTTDVSRIVIYGSANDNKVVLDFLPGSYGSKILAANGGVQVNFRDNSAASSGAGAGDDSLMLRGGGGADTYKFGKSISNSDIYIEISTDKIADILVKPSTVGGSSLALVASLGAGADTLVANPSVGLFDKFSATTGLSIGPMALGVTAFGGLGIDTFTGGFGADAFYGGDGNDSFKMNASADGADIYSGDVGLDTVDYGTRTGNLNVDLGPLSPTLAGAVNLASPALYGSGGTLNGTTLGFAIENRRVEATFTAPLNPAAVLDPINMAANLALSTSGVVYATLGSNNQLLISNPAGTPTSPVQLQGALAIASAPGTAADGILGLTPGAVTTAPIVGTADLSGLTFGAGGVLNTKRLVLVVNGLYVAVSFTSQANTAAVLGAINDAIDNELGTSGVLYATEGALHRLMLSAGSIAVKDGAAAKSLSSADAALGLSPGPAIVSVSDADDGLLDADTSTLGDQPEGDDVRYSTESILSGSGDDVLIGNALKNSIRGGLGNDTISGGANSACNTTDADSLLGDAGDDTFLAPVLNCRAFYSGGPGNNVIDFSGRSQNLVLKNDTTATDGETSEFANIGADVLKMIGGFGADVITGGVGADTIVGGPGGDTIIGGAGIADTVDYSASPSAINVSLCFESAVTSCGTANDGMTANGGEGDQVYQIEHLIGSAYADSLSASTAPASLRITIDGGDLGDTITGGAGADLLWGEAGDDTLHGGLGEDILTGGLGDDTFYGDGGGDSCVSDGSDTAAQLECEL